MCELRMSFEGFLAAALLSGESTVRVAAPMLACCGHERLYGRLRFVVIRVRGLRRVCSRDGGGKGRCRAPASSEEGLGVGRFSLGSVTLGVHGVVVRHGVDAVSRVNVRRAGGGVDVNIRET